MSRPRKPQTSADVEVEIRRLLEAKGRLVADEDQRRGALIREYLARSDGDALRDVLVPLVGARDAYLFGLDVARSGRLPERMREIRARVLAAPAEAPA
jgi:hypothetical protein